MVRYWPAKKEDQPPSKDIYHHDEIMKNIEAYEPERGASIAGHRGYFLKNHGVLLNQALINYGIAFLRKKGYTIMQTPFFMNKEIMAETAQLEQFDEELYKVTGDTTDKYLIATSEQPLSAFHRGEWLEPTSLPIKYCGYSTCFRKEAGASGKDAWGIFRVHQFEKVEQFVYSKPEDSNKLFAEMFAHSEEFYQSVGPSFFCATFFFGSSSPILIVFFVLNFPARAPLPCCRDCLRGLEQRRRQEVRSGGLVPWLWYGSLLITLSAVIVFTHLWPLSLHLGTYRELVSCSNCTDYQSRRMEIRYGGKKMDDKEKKYVHCLNSTLVATERAMCCIVENYQTPEGVNVPKVLQPFMGGIEFIPFIHKNHRPRDK